MSDLKALLYVWASLRFLNVTADGVVLSEARGLSAVRSVTPLPAVLQLPIVVLAGADLLYVALGVIDGPI